MKKILIYLGIFILILFCFIYVPKKSQNNNNSRTLKVAEVTHSAFYTPFYIAIQKGYFDEHNIDIDLILTSGANNVIAAVLSEDVEIGFCGPEASIYIYSEGEKDYIQSFAGLTKRDGQFIVSKNKIDNFTLDYLNNKEVLAGRPGGMPIINFQTALMNQNITNVIINDQVDFANLSSAFISSDIEFVNLFEPNATRLEKMGYGYVLDNIGKYSNIVPYTAFNAKKSFINNNQKLINNFRDAINKGIKYTKENSSKVLANDIIDLFPDTSLNDLETIIERYKKADSWFDSSFISEESFNNLQNMLLDNKLITKKVSYSDLITNG